MLYHFPDSGIPRKYLFAVYRRMVIQVNIDFSLFGHRNHIYLFWQKNVSPDRSC